MNHHNKGKAKNILAWLTALMLFVITLCANASGVKRFYFHISLTSDTIPPKKKTIKKNGLLRDSVKVIKDSLSVIANADTTVKSFIDSTNKQPADTTIKLVTDTIPFRVSKDTLDGPVTYHADDSMVFDVPGKKLLLYGKTSNVKYTDNELTAPLIEYNQLTGRVKAYLIKDSLGRVIAYPNFNQADFKTKSDSIEFDMRTLQGITKGTYTQQGEIYVYGEKIKKVDKDIFYAARARFTTCNLDTPHFAFISNKIKFINKKMAYSGPVHPEFEGVPLPIYLPFGIYPLNQGRHSGLLAPSFTSNQQRGLALENIGYYKIINQTWDIVTKGTIYSYGGWAANVSPRYFKRYRYQGAMAFDVQHFKTNFKGDPDFSVQNTYNVSWTHNADTKARPGVSFRAYVNAGSSKYNSQVPNSAARNITNQMSSNIAYQKVWKNKPFSILIGASHDQNSVTKLFNIKTPDVSFTVNSQYPFRRKDAVGNLKWYENISIGLSTTARGLTSFYDTAANAGKQLLKNYQWGISHIVPVTLSLPPIGPLQLSPSISYQERWYQRKTRLSFDSANKKFDTAQNNGFYTARDMNFALSAGTRIFGMFTFRKNSTIQAIRHELRPSVSVSYKPDFTGKSYYQVRLDSAGNTTRYSVYRGSVYPEFSEGKFGGLNFSLENNLQMKVKSKKDTGEAAIKKVNLLDAFNITGNYNFLIDSFKMSFISLTANTNLFNKVNITGNATFDPYLTNSQGIRYDKLVWGSKRPISLGSLTNAQIAMQTSLKGGTTKSNTSVSPANMPLQPLTGPNGELLDEYAQEAAYIRNNPGEFVDFSIPWSVNLSYSLRLTKFRVAGTSRLRSDFSHDITWDGSVNITPKWKLGLAGSYNITAKDLGTITMYLSREMHCWQMSINISQSPTYKFFTINISPKSNLLRDLKVNRTRYFYDQ